MRQVGFEPIISAGEWPQTYALDRAATGTGDMSLRTYYFRPPNLSLPLFILTSKPQKGGARKCTAIPRPKKTIRSGITFVSRNLC